MLRLSTVQLSEVRFAVSPLWEVGLAALVLRRPEPGVLFERWVRECRRRVAPEVLDRMTALTAGRDFVPDVFSPLPKDDHRELGDAIDHLRRVPEELLVRDLARLDAAHQGRCRWIRDLLDGRREAREEIIAVVTAFWDGAIGPHWAAFERLARSDIAQHAVAAARLGQGAMFEQLHPDVTWTGTALDIAGACDTSFGPTPSEGGVLLAPSAFAWPDVHVMSNAPYQPAIAYAVRGFAALWEDRAGPAVPVPAVRRLMGAGRARVAGMITTPATTTQIAHALGMAPGTVSEHLRTLTDARLAGAVRDGRTVVYSLTDLGRELLAE